MFDLPHLCRELDNGLRVIIVNNTDPDVVNLQIPVLTGSRNEVEPGKSGFAHFFEHMMFRGTKRYPPQVYGEIMKNAGADQNAYTTDDYTNFHITFTKQDLGKIIALEADRFQNLAYSEDHFRTEALAVKGEYLKNYSDPTEKLFEVLRDAAFTTHPYKHTTMGFFEDIQNMPNEQAYSRTFFERWYRPEHTAIIITGDVDPEVTLALVEKYWGTWRRGSYQAKIPVEPPPQGPIYKHIQWEAPTQPWLMLAFRGPAFDPADKAKPGMDLLGQLYFGETSALYHKLVVQEQSVDTLFHDFPDQVDPSLLLIGARLSDPADAAGVTQDILNTAAAARTEMVSADRLARMTSHLRYALAGALDHSEAIGDVLAAFSFLNRDPIGTIERLYETYAAIEPADLAHYANRYFTDQGSVVVSLAQDESLAGMQTLPSIDAEVSARASKPDVAIEMIELASDAPLVEVAYVFKVGAARDPVGKKGLGALTAAMVVDGGSQYRTLREIEEARFPMAAEFSAQVDKEMTTFAGTVHKDKLAEWYRLAGEQLLHPGWREADFKRLKRQQINAIRTDLCADNDEELGKEMLYQFIYGPEHPYGSYNLGAVGDLEAIRLDDVEAFYQRYYVPENLTIGLAGGYQREFAAQVKQDALGLPAGEHTMLELPKSSAIRGHEALIVCKQTPAVAVSFGFPIAVTRGDPDWVALWLVRSWLGEHRASVSHLYQRIREIRGMNYGDYAYIEYFPRGMFEFQPDTNLARRSQIFQVWLRPLRDNNDAQFATRAAVFELQKLLDNGMREADFEATRNYLDKFVSLLAMTQSRRLGYKIDSAFYGIEEFTDYVRAGLKELTLAKVNNAIQRHLQTSNMKFVFVAENADDLRARLIANQRSPIEYNSRKPDALVAEDKRIEALPMQFNAQSVRVVSVDEVSA